VFPYYDAIVGGVPDFEGYLGLDELEASTSRFASAHAGIDVWQAGASRAGDPIRCIEIRGGRLQALLVGAPHPEEPVGTLLMEYLLPLLADGLAEELGFSFSLVKVADPDGMRFNEPWFGQPYDLAGFLLRVYRPPLAEQFEWTFPVQYKRYGFTKPLPEARAVMEVTQRRPLDLYMGLHNSSFSGSYFYISDDDDALRDELAAVMTELQLPPHCGEPEVPYVRKLSDGVFHAFALADDYDYHERYGADPAVLLTSGTSSDAYAESMWDCFTVVAEAPCFTSGRIADASPAGLSRREAKLQGLEVARSNAIWLHERYVKAAAHLTRETAWQRAVHAHLSSVKDDLRAERTQAETDPKFAREATVAELFDALYLREMDTLSRVGQFANMVAAEPEQNETLVDLRADAEARVRTRSSLLASAGGLEAVPIRTLVQCQLAALLCSLVAVRDRYRQKRPRPAGPRPTTR
jgi:hypothetical protein